MDKKNHLDTWIAVVIIILALCQQEFEIERVYEYHRETKTIAKCDEHLFIDTISELFTVEEIPDIYHRQAISFSNDFIPIQSFSLFVVILCVTIAVITYNQEHNKAIILNYIHSTDGEK